MSGDGRGQNKEAYDTGYSQAVTHPSTNPARQSLTSVIGREPVFFFFFISKKPERAVFIGNNIVSLHCFCLSLRCTCCFNYITCFRICFLLHFHAIIQFPYNVSTYQFLSLRYTCCFHYLFSRLFFLLLCSCCRFCCKRFYAFSIFTPILQMKNEFVVIDGS